jgi:hypothetical protein
MKLTWRLVAFLAGAALSSGCGGGGGSSATPGSLGNTIQSAQTATATLSIFIPSSASPSSKSRRPLYVSSTTNGIKITNSAHGSATPFNTVNADLSPGSGACTTIVGRTCTVTMISIAGNDDYTFATYDVAPSSPSFGTAAHQLGTATLSSIAIAGGTTNTVNVALSGIVNSISLVGAASVSTYRATTHSGSVGVSFSGLDVDGNVISAGQNTATNGSVSQTDTYANPITLTVTEHGGTGHTTLALNGGSTSNAITLTKSTDTFGVSYDGLGSTGYYVTIAASASGVSSGPSLTFSTLSASAAGSASNASVGGTTSSVGFQVSTQSETITLTEPNFAGTFSATLANYGTAACPTNSMAINAGSLAGSGTSFTLTPGSVSTTSLGCQISVSDGIGASTTIFASTTYGSGGGTIGVPINFLYATTFGITGSCTGAQDIAPNISPGCATALYDPTILRVNLADGTTTDSFTYNLGGGCCEPIGIAHDSSGNVYITDYFYHYIVKFAATASGTASPAALMSGSSISGADGIGVDSSGNIYVSDFTLGTVAQYAPLTSSLFGTATPSKMIATGLTNPSALTLDSAGNVYVVVNNAKVNEYAAPNFTLLRTYTVSQAAGVAVDPSGDVFISECCSISQVVEFAPGASTPTATFSSSVSGFAFGISGVATDAAGNLYVMGSQNGSGLMQYGIFTVSSPSTPMTVHAFAASPVFSNNESVAPGYGAQGLMAH